MVHCDILRTAAVRTFLHRVDACAASERLRAARRTVVRRKPAAGEWRLCHDRFGRRRGRHTAFTAPLD